MPIVPAERADEHRDVRSRTADGETVRAPKSFAGPKTATGST